ncbi:3-keto-5-aminohexanoate cleavage protein [Streptomyces sp. PCS3-D2]|uniref:3-keto-5-aminohexanoate cleavage protein n=1 Tax=Streptomyces sp. PCS3-D2 TaxID=1460244 RepID=UPI000448692E|nr:3-keto-5-aminohexanoate cleavage protein [Streptomyces sp. PCS3-D2]WKV74870.1 3-keto-5-aminohexanoate cleavage protein [Streptomyces sp. PCS3-D2]
MVALNGSRCAGDGPAVPMSPQDLTESAVRAVAAGAGEVLVHPRTPCGRESLSPRVVGPVLEALRGAGVGVPLAVPAGIAAEADPAERLARVGAWTVLPDRAVVHFADPGAAGLAEALLARGVGVDAVAPLGLRAGPEPLERLRAWLARSPGGRGGGVRVVAEITSGHQDGPATGPALPAGLRGLPPETLLLFGRDGASWPALRLAARCGTAARTGVGDVLHLPDGRPARSNAELVSAARELLPRNHGPEPHAPGGRPADQAGLTAPDHAP